jgi:hypothetical protein
MCSGAGSFREVADSSTRPSRLARQCFVIVLGRAAPEADGAVRPLRERPTGLVVALWSFSSLKSSGDRTVSA